MSLKKELRSLSKGELIRIILNQEDRISKLENHLRAYDNPHTPSAKIRTKENTTHDDETRFPGKPKGGNGGGIDLPPPDKEEHVSMESCPKCGERLGKSFDRYQFRQMDIPEPSFITTRYVVERYNCSHCGCEVDAGDHLQKGFYGKNTTALIGYLKKEGLSCGSISDLFKDVYKLPISSVAVLNKLYGFSRSLSQEREQLKKKINQSSYVNMDETGLRKDGSNGFVWGACIPDTCIFEYDKTRAAEVPKRMLSNFHGAIVTDDYCAYDWYPLRQLCWSHLLREAKEYAEEYKDSAVQYNRLKILYDKAKRAQHAGDSTKYEMFAWELEDIATCYHSLDGCKRMHAKIHNRSSLWLLGTSQLDVPLTNNHAERCLRKIVLQRNRIGCIRTKKGEEFVNNFLSCVATWKLRDKNIFRELLKYAS